jgi:hypothetical protein
MRDLGDETSAVVADARNTSPIVPRGSIAGRALIAVVAIMTFLASMTTGAVLLVRASASEWQSDVASELTIQIRPSPGRDIERDTRAVVDAARAQPGVVEVRPFTKEESAKLLEPWLGTGLSLDDLPVPRVVVARVAQGTAPDFAALRTSITQAAPGASVDDHRAWIERMRSMTGAIVLAGTGILILVIIATVISVVCDQRRDGSQPADCRSAAFRRCARPLYRQSFPAALSAAWFGRRFDRRPCRDADIRFFGIHRQLVLGHARGRSVRGFTRNFCVAGFWIFDAWSTGGDDRNCHSLGVATDALCHA